MTSLDSIEIVYTKATIDFLNRESFVASLSLGEAASIKNSQEDR